MNPSAQPISVNDILSAPAFWSKLAAVDDERTPERQENVLHGFIHEMKTAGASPFLIAGLLDGMSKEADAATATGYTVTPTGQVAPVAGDHWWNNIKAESGGWWDKTRHFLGNDDPALVSKIVNHDAAASHPTVSGIGKAIFSDPQQQAAFNIHLGNGEYGKALSMAGDHIGSSDMVKKWAPTVVPALAGVGAGRLAGMGWGGSLALGAGAGLLGHEAHAVGGYQNLSNDLLGTKFPGTARPTPPAAPAEAARLAPGEAAAAGGVAGAIPGANMKETPGANRAPAPLTGAAADAERTKDQNAYNAGKIHIPAAGS